MNDFNLPGKDYEGPDRRQGLPFTDEQKEQINAIAEHAVQKAMNEYPMQEIVDRAAMQATKKITDEIYKTVGKGVVQKAVVIIGVVTTAAYLWLQNKGLIGPGG